MRHRLLQSVSLSLYAGPLLAGLGGYGWATVPAFLMVFVMWLGVLRPEGWPQTAEEWHSPRAYGQALTQISGQAALILICLAIGRGIGGVFDVVLVLHPILPVALSLSAILVLRLLWAPQVSAWPQAPGDFMLQADANTPALTTPVTRVFALQRA